MCMQVTMLATIVTLPVAILLEGSKVRWIAEHILFCAVVEWDIQLCIMIVLSRALPHRCAISRRLIFARERDNAKMWESTQDLVSRMIFARERDSAKMWESTRDSCESRTSLLELPHESCVSRTLLRSTSSGYLAISRYSSTLSPAYTWLVWLMAWFVTHMGHVWLMAWFVTHMGHVWLMAWFVTHMTHEKDVARNSCARGISRWCTYLQEFARMMNRYFESSRCSSSFLRNRYVQMRYISKSRRL